MSDESMDELIWNDTFTNLSWDHGARPPDFTAPSSLVATVLGSIVNVAIVLANTLLIMSLISSGGFMKEPFKIILLHLAVLDLTLGIASVPFLIHYVFVGHWNLGRAVCTVWMALDHFLLVLILVTWLVLMLDRLLFAFRPPRYRQVVKFWVALVMVWVPWVTCSFIGGPLYYVSLTDEYVPLTECYNEWKLSYYMIFIILTFFVPFGFCLFVMILTIIIQCRSNEASFSKRTSASINADRSLAAKSTLILGLGNISLMLMWLPFFAVTLSDIMSDYSNTLDSWVSSLLYWIVYSNSAVRPPFWFVLRDIRQSCYRLLTRACQRRPESADQYTQTTREKEVRFIDFDCSNLKSADV